MNRKLPRILIILFFSTNCLFANDLSEIDNYINSAISYQYFPGAQLVVGTSQKILYSKSYGYIDYENTAPVTDNTLYDLASLTKVIAATTAIMKLYDEGKIYLDAVVIYFIPEFAKNGKSNVRIQNLLLHDSGLKAWVPFYQTCRNKNDVINEICNLELTYPTGTQTVYSDLNAILLSEIVERVSGQSFDKYCEENIFKPLGMNSTFFNPPKNNLPSIAPTEYDGTWRARLIHGEVHDEAAAVMGGVSGNAGLFANARDVALLVQMLLNNGQYFNPDSQDLRKEQFCSPETITKFLSKGEYITYYSTRAHGWDTKPEPTRWRSQSGELMSANCFGHTGFTGTSVWADRDKDLFIVFLTNRVYKTRRNTGILEFRPELHNRIIEILSN